MFLRLIVVIILSASQSQRAKRGLGAPSIQRPTFMTDHRHLQGRVSKRQVCMYACPGAVQLPLELCQSYHLLLL